MTGGAGPSRSRGAGAALASIDGGSRGNPGEAGCGFVLLLPDGRREEHAVYLGRATNNVAEYAALLAAMEQALRLGVEALEVRADSELLVRQMTGAYRVKAAHLQRLWLRASQLAREFRSFAITHVPRHDNAVADRLANQAMDTKSSSVPVPAGVA